MKLPRCPEPTKLGGIPIKFEGSRIKIKGISTEEIKRQLNEEALAYANIPLLGSQGLPSYLWTDYDWKSILKEKGMNWQIFLEIISFCEADIKNWILGGISWENLLNNIENSKQMQRYLMRE